MVLTLVTFPKELHSHDSKDENDDAQHESQITQSSDSFTHDWNEQIQRGPWFG